MLWVSWGQSKKAAQEIYAEHSSQASCPHLGRLANLLASLVAPRGQEQYPQTESLLACFPLGTPG